MPSLCNYSFPLWAFLFVCRYLVGHYGAGPLRDSSSATCSSLSYLRSEWALKGHQRGKGLCQVLVCSSWWLLQHQMAASTWLLLVGTFRQDPERVFSEVSIVQHLPVEKLSPQPPKKLPRGLPDMASPRGCLPLTSWRANPPDKLPRLPVTTPVPSLVRPGFHSWGPSFRGALLQELCPTLWAVTASCINYFPFFRVLFTSGSQFPFFTLHSNSFHSLCSVHLGTRLKREHCVTWLGNTLKKKFWGV